MEQKIVKMDQMNLKLVAQLIVQKTISNVTIQNVFTNHLCVMEKMTVVMQVTSPLNMHVDHLMLFVNQDFGLVQDSQTFVLTKIRSVMTNRIAQMVRMKVPCVTMQIVITTEDNALMDAYKLLWEHYVHVPKEKL
jgi:hypothetical protein